MRAALLEPNGSEAEAGEGPMTQEKAPQRPKPEVPKGLAEAIRKARQDPEFAERIERLKRQNFNPLAVIARAADEKARTDDGNAREAPCEAGASSEVGGSG